MDLESGDPNEALAKDDPFAQHAAPHPALRAGHDLSSDIYGRLFDWFFESEVFARWIQRNTTRQLYCTGAPGSGKTTLTALMAARIRELHTTTAATDPKTYVATLYVHQYVVGSGLAFLEDFLHNVFVQLAPVGTPVERQTSRIYEDYSEARRVGKRATARIDLIAKAVRARLREPQIRARAFLLVDGLDQCTPSLQQLLERELLAMQQAGLRIMVASRLAVYERMADFYCDFHERDLYESPLSFYWQCMSCEKSIICESCKEDGKLCDKCGSDTVWAEPRYMDVPVERIPAHVMRDFVAWDLEGEHGDLRLESENEVKPPLSALGISFLEAEAGATAQDWVERIVNDAHGSIALAKLGLDRVHRSTSVDAIEFTPPDRLPRNVQAMFDEGLISVQGQPALQRDLALKAIAAAAKDGLDYIGTPVSLIEKALRERPHGFEHKYVPPRSVEDLLQAARGYLRLEPPWGAETEYQIAVYNFPFALYAVEGYNDDLVWANAQLRTSNIPRSFTQKFTEDGPGNESERSREDILGDLKKFHTQSPPPMGSSESPMGRRTSPLLRSNTGMARGAPKRRAKLVGLGLDM